MKKETVFLAVLGMVLAIPAVASDARVGEMRTYDTSRQAKCSEDASAKNLGHSVDVRRDQIRSSSAQAASGN